MHKGESGVPDFVLLNEVSENAIVQNLQVRFQGNFIYTYIGEVIVSINPYKKLEHLYSQQNKNEYKGTYHYEKPPHIYSLSNNAYRRMLQYGANQCVIISGESGAGKTEASKIMMQYLAVVSKSSTEVDRVKNQLLDSNPILEAFGNAKTVRNDNSSRFGKYMEIQFEHDGSPVGGRITNYLLEKSRVVIRSQGERAFHIFYQLLTGDVSQFQLDRDANKYNYLRLSNCIKVDTINDAGDFKLVTSAMDTLGFSAQDKKQIFSIVAGILHIGNLEFQTVPQGNKTVVTIKNMNQASVVESVLQLVPNSLTRALTSRSITTGVGKRGSSINIPLDEKGANFTRDALAKGMYSRLFDHIVEHINKRLACPNPGEKVMIGLLDIYGFEIFDNNSFEQFCINLCNEKLQQLFIELTLKSEQEEYVREGIKWEPVKYFNNEIIVQLIEGKGKTQGITLLMDECGWVADSTDQTLLEKLDQVFGKHAHYESWKTSKNKTIKDSQFIIKHYAGDVTYNVDGFLEKNKDTFFIDLTTCMQGSSNPLIQSLFPNVEINSKKRPLTAATQFKNALNELMAKLLACQPHYIRCIKPNDEKRPGVFNEERVRHQVRYLGLLENVRVRRAGFAFRQLYDRFFWRYKMIAQETWPGPSMDPKSGTQKILTAHQISQDEFRFGHTKVFLRNPKTLFYLEEQREKYLPEIVTLMIAGWKGYNARRKWNKVKSATKLQLYYRRYRFNKWFWDLKSTFANVANDPNLGYFITWPQHPLVLENGVALLKKVHANWRAQTIIDRLSSQQQAELRQKCFTYTIFHGKKPWDCARRFEADYLDMDTNPNRVKYQQICQKLFSTYGDSEVMFADYAIKINSKHKGDRRGIVVTEKNIYKHNPKSFAIKKFETPLVHVRSICMSKFKDTFVVVLCEPPYRDLVLDFGINGAERTSEFVTTVLQGYKKLTGKDLDVLFLDQIQYNNGRSPKNPNGGVTCNLTFQPSDDPKLVGSTFKKGSNNANVVLYRR